MVVIYSVTINLENALTNGYTVSCRNIPSVGDFTLRWTVSLHSLLIPSNPNNEFNCLIVNISLEEFVVVRRWQHELREFCPQILPTTECANISMAFYPSRNPLLIISKAVGIGMRKCRSHLSSDTWLLNYIAQ